MKFLSIRACASSDAGTCAGGKVGVAALGIARLCYDTLISDGYKAKAALEAGACTKSVEKIIEANTLLSGIGFESGGLAGAHAIHNGLTVLPECHHMQHGEKVNFGTLTQLVLENSPEDELYEVLDFCCSVGLPVCLKDLALDSVSEEELQAIAEKACIPEESIHNMPFPVTVDMVKDAIKTADKIGSEFKAKYFAD